MSDVDSNETGSFYSWTYYYYEQEKAQLDGEADQSILVKENSPLLMALESFTDQDHIHPISCPGPSPPSEAHDGASDFDELIDDDFSSIESGRDDTSDFVELSCEDDDSVSVQSSTDGSEHEETSSSPDEDSEKTLQKIEAFVLDIIQQINQSGKYHTPGEEEPSRKPAKRPSPIAVSLRNRASSDAEGYHTRKFPRFSHTCSGGSGSMEIARILYLLELSQDLILGDMVVTKRDAFYRDVNLFKTQQTVDRLVDDLAATLNLTREKLHIIASPRGMLQGDLELVTVANQLVSGHGPPMHIPPPCSIKDLRPGHDAHFVLIVEKEAIFHLLVDMDFTHDPWLGHSILICGMGYPDVATRRLACQLSEYQDINQRRLPILMLTDCDPHGLGIATVYKFGSRSMSFHPGLCAERAEWIGVHSSDWNGIDSSYLCTMSSRDNKKVEQLLKLNVLPGSWKRELESMRESGYKSEIQIILTDPRRKAGDQETQSYNRNTHNPLLLYLRTKIKPKTAMFC